MRQKTILSELAAPHRSKVGETGTTSSDRAGGNALGLPWPFHSRVRFLFLNPTLNSRKSPRSAQRWVEAESVRHLRRNGNHSQGWKNKKEIAVAPLQRLTVSA